MRWNQISYVLFAVALVVGCDKDPEPEPEHGQIPASQEQETTAAVENEVESAGSTVPVHLPDSTILGLALGSPASELSTEIAGAAGGVLEMATACRAGLEENPESDQVVLFENQGSGWPLASTVYIYDGVVGAMTFMGGCPDGNAFNNTDYLIRDFPGTQTPWARTEHSEGLADGSILVTVTTRWYRPYPDEPILLWSTNLRGPICMYEVGVAWTDQRLLDLAALFIDAESPNVLRDSTFDSVRNIDELAQIRRYVERRWELSLSGDAVEVIDALSESIGNDRLQRDLLIERTLFTLRR